MLTRMKFSVITSATMQICVRLAALIGSSLAPSHKICESCLWASSFLFLNTWTRRREKKKIIKKKKRAKFRYLVAGLGSVPTSE